MNLRAWVAAALGSALVSSFAAAAQDRPDENAMFGSDAPAVADAGTPEAATASPRPELAPAPTPHPAGNAHDQAQEDEALTGTPAADAFASGRLKEDWLKIGGQFYERAYGSYGLHQRLDAARVSVPTLVDVYLDARPTDRLRAQVTGRMQYDPFLGTSSSIFSTPTAGTVTPAPANPSIGLDQAWLAFDLGHAVFITAGRQHVKWGTAHFFSPTDFLASRYRDPLSVVDTRLGVTMVKASIPWEAAGWNFYAVAVFEPTQQPATGLGSAGSSGSTQATGNTPATNGAGTTLGDIGGAVRAEATFGQTVVGIDGLAQKGRKARAGLDLTTPLGPYLDLYGEASIRSGSDVQLYHQVAHPNPLAGLAGRFVKVDPAHPPLGVAAGITSDLALANNRSLNLGLEYFYNSAGYSDAHIYPWLLFTGTFQPFYTGQHYGAFSATLSDTEAKSTYVLSNIGNLSDASFIVRGDYLVTVLSYLQFSAFAGVHYGTPGGEFRLQVNVAQADVPGITLPGGRLYSPAPVVDLGVGLRLSL